MSIMKSVVQFSCAAALLYQHALACEQWNIGGQKTIEQSNGIVVLADFTQDGDALGGTAEFVSTTLNPDIPWTVEGAVKGVVSAGAVQFRVEWSTEYIHPDDYTASWASTGVYHGSIDESGSVSGTSFDVKDAANKAGWTMVEPAQCAVAAKPAPEAISPGMEDNTDRYGSDYRSFFLDARKPELCQAACIEDGDKCKAWTYVRPGVQGDQPVCYLKDRSSQTSANTCCISGVPPKMSDAIKEPGGFAKPSPDKSGAVREQGAGVADSVSPGMENNTDRPGSDYARFVLTEASPKNCQTACAADTGCAAWTYVRPGVQEANAICYLKRPAPAPVANNCCISGKKSQNPAAFREQQ